MSVMVGQEWLLLCLMYSRIDVPVRRGSGYKISTFILERTNERAL